MADYEWDTEPQDNNPPAQSEGPKGLRDAYERQKAANKELQDQLKALSDKVRVSEVSSKLTSLGLPEKAVKLFPRDIEPTDDAVKTWVEEYGDLFGSSTPPKTPEPASNPEPSKPPVDTQNIQSELTRMNSVAQGGAPAGPITDLQAILNNPRAVNEYTLEQFEEVLRKNGANV